MFKEIWKEAKEEQDILDKLKEGKVDFLPDIKPVFDKHTQNILEEGEVFLEKRQKIYQDLLDLNKKSLDTSKTDELIENGKKIKICGDDFLFAKPTKENYRTQLNALSYCSSLNASVRDWKSKEYYLTDFLANEQKNLSKQLYKIIIIDKNFCEKYPKIFENFVSIVCNGQVLEAVSNGWKKAITNSKPFSVDFENGEKIKKIIKENNIKDCYCVLSEVATLWTEYSGCANESKLKTSNKKITYIGNLFKSFKKKFISFKIFSVIAAIVLGICGYFLIKNNSLNIITGVGILLCFGCLVSLFIINYKSLHKGFTTYSDLENRKDFEFAKVYYELLQNLSNQYESKYKEKFNKLYNDSYELSHQSLERIHNYNSSLKDKHWDIVCRILPLKLLMDDNYLSRILSKLLNGYATSYKEALNLVELDIAQETRDTEDRKFREKQAEEERRHRQQIMDSQLRAEEYAREQALYSQKQAEYAKEQAENEKKQAENLQRIRDIEEDRKWKEDFDRNHR